MLRTRVIPCLLLKDESLVKTVKFKKPNYIGDPINTVRIFNEKEVDELILLDISVTQLKKEPNFQLIKKIANECFMPIAYGGGITKIEQVKKLFELGVEKVVLNNTLINDFILLEEISKTFGSQSVICCVNYKKKWLSGKYGIYDYVKNTIYNINIVDYVLSLEQLGAGEILLNAVDLDGTMSGFDLDMVKEITQISSVPIIASGGASSMDDIKQVVKNAHASAVALGSMVVYQNTKKNSVLINFPSFKQRQEYLTTI